MTEEIQLLPKEIWRHHALPMAYETQNFYDAEISTKKDRLFVQFTKKEYEIPAQIKPDGDFPDRLYEDWWDGAEAYGIVQGGELLAAVEIWHEIWSKRLRVTELWVHEALRRCGVGARLMALAKTRAQELGCRAILIETQSCNENAIAFYLAQGYTFFGFDRCCYGNQDVENRQVRLELGLYLEDT